jgi:hypothetical protein
MTYKGKPIKITTDFLTETLTERGLGVSSFKPWKKTISVLEYSTQKASFKIDKQKLK